MWITLLAWTASNAHAACERAPIAEVLELLPEVQGEDRVGFVVMALGEACTGPAGWVAGARDLAMVSPEQWSTVDLTVAAHTPNEWMAVCSGGLPALIETSKVARSETRPLLWSSCDLERHGWMTEAEWATADGLVVFALVGGHVLGEVGVADADVATLVRAMAGVRGASGPVDKKALLASADRPAGFTATGRVEPTWSKAALRNGGSCTVQVFVSRQGTLEDMNVVDCDKALEDSVRAAVEASTLLVRLEEGQVAAGRFTATYQAR